MSSCKHNLLFQSGFKAFHSSVSALSKVFKDILLSIYSGDSALLMVSAITAAIESVDNNCRCSPGTLCEFKSHTKVQPSQVSKLRQLCNTFAGLSQGQQRLNGPGLFNV